MKNLQSKPGAWLCTNEENRQNRGRLKTYQPGSKIYLNDNDEFEIELHNPTINNIKAEISIDGKPICNGGIVIRRGERLYLECFPDSRKKFTFKTYSVEDTKESREAISNNGRVNIKFYTEKSNNFINLPSNIYTSDNSEIFNWQNDGFNNSGYKGNLRSSSVFSSTNINNNVFNTTSIACSDSLDMETGQVDGGSQSDQEFISVNMEFNTIPSWEFSFHVLPMSQKPLNQNSFKSKKKKKSKVSDKLESLLILTDLKDNGNITQDEFDKLKRELI